MRIFVTGATGFIGSAVVQNLLGAGHQIVGLSRSDAAADALTSVGASVHRGSLEDLDSLRAGASAADGVIHLGFIHDFSRFAENCEIDRHAITALGSALAGSNRPLVVTSGIGLLPQGRIATEDSAPAGQNPRVASEEAARAVAGRGVAVSIVRLPPSVHGDGDHGFVPILITLARDTGVSAYVDGGDNRWTAVHRLDAARLFRLAIEKAEPEAVYHGVAEQGIAFREIAEAIGRRLGLPVVSRTKEQAAAHFGWFAHFAALDVPASSAHTRDALGWRPTQAGLLEDLERPSYFPTPGR
ncbi:MAG: SDR family oxidoreductase [Vicinamibacteraceae bacterium]